MCTWAETYIPYTFPEHPPGASCHPKCPEVRSEPNVHQELPGWHFHSSQGDEGKTSKRRPGGSESENALEKNNAGRRQPLPLSTAWPGRAPVRKTKLGKGMNKPRE